jgi:hypothetical protein
MAFPTSRKLYRAVFPENLGQKRAKSDEYFSTTVKTDTLGYPLKVCLKYENCECDNRGCRDECAQWSADSNWFQRHILGNIMAIGNTALVFLAGYGAWMLLKKDKSQS